MLFGICIGLRVGLIVVRGVVSGQIESKIMGYVVGRKLLLLLFMFCKVFRSFLCKTSPFR